MKFLAQKRKNKILLKPIHILDSPEKLSSLSNPIGIQILKMISEKPSYPAEIAKKLNMHEQKVYYHIRKLEKSGIIIPVREEIKKGAVCKFYSPVSSAFGFELDKKYFGKESEDKNIFEDFFYEYIKDGVFNGSIVVGSPSSHGPYLTSARDGHCAIQLAMLLGKLCELPDKFIAKLDTEVKSERKEKRNLILIGGPITNIITSELNDNLKIRFLWKNGWKIYSSFTKKEYKSEDLSIVAKINNPWDNTKKIILFAGLKFEGTKSGIISVTQYYKKTLRNYKKGREFYSIIKSLDKDGDGKTDDVKVVESHTV